MEGYTFEAAMARLEAIVRSLEEGKLTLEDSLAAFEEGIRLVKLCTGQLDNAEQRVKLLMEGDGGSVLEQPFVKKESVE